MNYPIFHECANLTSDNYWKTIFDNLSNGKFPPGIYISENSLCYGIKGKDFRYPINDKDAQTIFDDLIDLFKTKLELLSNDDITEKKLEINNRNDKLDELIIDDWDYVSRKNNKLKSSILEKFVIDCKYNYNLSDDEFLSLHNHITTSITFGTIKNSDIIYNDGKIDKIIGIDFDKNE